MPRGAAGRAAVEGGGYEREPRRCRGDAEGSPQVRRSRRRKREGERAVTPGTSGEPGVGPIVRGEPGGSSGSSWSPRVVQGNRHRGGRKDFSFRILNSPFFPPPCSAGCCCVWKGILSFLSLPTPKLWVLYFLITQFKAIFFFFLIFKAILRFLGLVLLFGCVFPG